MTLQPYFVEKLHLRITPIDEHIWRNVLHRLRHTTDETVVAESTELMSCSSPGNDHVVANGAMTRQGILTAHDEVVANDAIVSYVRIGEEHIVVSDGGKGVVFSSAMDGGKFSKDILITDFETGFTTVVFEVLSFGPHTGVREDLIVFS